MSDHVYATYEVAVRHCPPGKHVYKMTNPHRAPLYVVAHDLPSAAVWACIEWGINGTLAVPEPGESPAERDVR